MKRTIDQLALEALRDAHHAAKFDRRKYKPDEIVAYVNGDPITYQQILDDMAKADEIQGLIGAAARGVAAGIAPRLERERIARERKKEALQESYRGFSVYDAKP